jgi:hypothetical protein
MTSKGVHHVQLSKEQLDAPAGLIDLSNGNCRKREVVGQESQPLVGLGIKIVHPPQGVRIGLDRFDGSQDHGVIGPQAD